MLHRKQPQNLSGMHRSVFTAHQSGVAGQCLSWPWPCLHISEDLLTVCWSSSLLPSTGTSRLCSMCPLLSTSGKFPCHWRRCKSIVETYKRHVKSLLALSWLSSHGPKQATGVGPGQAWGHCILSLTQWIYRNEGGGRALHRGNYEEGGRKKISPNYAILVLTSKLWSHTFHFGEHLLHLINQQKYIICLI